jgi:F0F1-type ATP synthase membrane subunit b/b'
MSEIDRLCAEMQRTFGEFDDQLARLLSRAQGMVEQAERTRESLARLINQTTKLQAEGRRNG